MNEEQTQGIEALASAWTVETTDLTQRVAAAVGAVQRPTDTTALLLDEIHAMRREMAEFRSANAQLHEEIVRLRMELTAKRATRLAPYASIDNLARLS